jgi:UDP-glucose-4-epimerase GalE
MRIMVTGGAGYIGSVITLQLLKAGHSVVVYDDLSRGHRSAVLPDAELVVADVRDADRLTATLARCRCAGVVHMAALAEVAESVARPDLYADVNVAGTRSLARAAVATGVERVVFSSTAAVYGAPDEMPVGETATPAPSNPYGETKLAAECLLAEHADHFGVAALRYFNACGAEEGYGEDHRPESHLIPLALRAARDGQTMSVYGTDYPTPDGTCVRDYIHVADLADAHLRALERLPDRAGAYNLGTSSGDSVLDVIGAVESVTGRHLATRVEARRPGDPPVLVAANDCARRELGWRPRKSLVGAVDDAWTWMQDHPGGYPD